MTNIRHLTVELQYRSVDRSFQFYSLITKFRYIIPALYDTAYPTLIMPHSKITKDAVIAEWINTRLA